MRWIFYGWFCPLAFLGTWYGLSYNNISFGYFMLTREANDLVFQIYADQLGLPKEDLPGLVLKAIIVDTAILFLPILWRRRAQIRAFLEARGILNPKAQSSAPSAAAIEDNLSSAP